MSQSSREFVERLPWYLRAVLVVGGATAVTLLVTAWMLRADSRGYGTHQQLGLPPCTFQQLFDMRCPSCGMTTSWALITRGQVAAAFQANVGGAVLAVLAAAIGPWCFASGVRGRWCGVQLNEWVALITLIAVMTVTIMDWCVRLWWSG
ncbi:MAG: DUF2752 domain-containing protein [Pirellulaceae bacterium]